jgi:histidinol phosphatase-like PHP family hydrolase
MIWLKGDVHCHSKFSDGDSSVKDVLDEAKKRAKLDFLAITDHDTHFQNHPDSFDDLVRPKLCFFDGSGVVVWH